MRSLIRLIPFSLGLAIAAQAAHLNYYSIGGDASSWGQVFASVGITPGKDDSAPVLLVRSGSAADPAKLRELVQRGTLLIVEGESPAATAFGFSPTAQRMSVRSVRDMHMPELPIIWQDSVELPVFTVPIGAQIFAREKWHDAALLAAVRIGKGAVLWAATAPGSHGYERFPYVLQALTDLGLQPPFVSKDLWAFFDTAYRSRVDVEYFAQRWRKAGISTLHVAGWHYFEPDAERDAYLQKLIVACHREAILVYVWLELPHVSEQFWLQHPEWREQTALLQDAQLDWRKLMNMQNRDCFRQVAQGTFNLLQRFDWDGINMAELYFESLEGEANPSRFTPMNHDVRLQFAKAYGFDPVELFSTTSEHSRAEHPEDLKKFLHFRARLTEKMQSEWLEVMRFAQEKKHYLELVLTHVDDRYDTRMRDLIGADAARVLPLLDQREFTFLIEDPATIWNLGPERYPQIAARYQPLTPHQDRLAIDINIVERYQDVYPTKQQTGTELFQLVHVASRAFPRVTLYFENSLMKPDLELLPSAAAVVDQAEWAGQQLIISSPAGVGVPWSGPALVDGRPWPFADSSTAWLPPGRHTIEAGTLRTPLSIQHFNGRLQAAAMIPGGITFTYRSDSRALAMLSSQPAQMELDGEAATSQWVEPSNQPVLILPRGTHTVKLWAVPVILRTQQAGAQIPTK